MRSTAFAPQSIEDLWDLIADKCVGAVGFIIKAAVCIALFYILTKVMGWLLGGIKRRLETKVVDPTALGFVLNLIKYSILIFAVVTMVIQLKIVEAASVAALIASAGVGVSLALQGVLSNFAGGILLMVLRPFKKGDYIFVQSQNVEGTVEEIQMYYTTIRTINNERVRIPNSALTNNSVVNRMGGGKRVLLIHVGVRYDSDIKKAKEVLRQILDEEKRITGDAKNVFVDELSDSSVKLGILGQVKTSDFNPVKRAVNERILERFREEGIEIPYNQLDVHILGKDKEK
ncbi:MAG: mechanosensitive ion channel family protein [Clostridiales bacterium]|nr:mechanosensitive ion channel family protein [Clostridiales bacterium]